MMTALLMVALAQMPANNRDRVNSRFRLFGPTPAASSSSGPAAPTFRFAYANGAGMAAECADNPALFAVKNDGTQYPVVGARYSAVTDDDSLTDQLWDGGKNFPGGIGVTECVATCTKGDQMHVTPGNMVCMSPNSPRITAGDGGVLGIMTEGAYHQNTLGESSNLASPQWLNLTSGGGAHCVVTANVCKDPFGAMTGDRVQCDADTAGQRSFLDSYHGCGNTAGDTVASAYFANFDGGTTLQHPRIAFDLSTGVIGAECDSTGAGDGGLLYTRCASPSALSDQNMSFLLGNYSWDGGASAAIDICFFGGQCENSSRHVTSYIPNDAPGTGDGSGTATQPRFVDAYGVVLPFAVAPNLISMSTTVWVPSTYDSSSQKYESLDNGTADNFVEIVSGYDNNSPDFSTSTWWHMGQEKVVGMYPALLNASSWNHFSMKYSVDGGTLTHCMNGACDAGALSDTLTEFVPTGQGYVRRHTDGGWWNICGDTTATHAAFGICHDVCLSLNADPVCQ